MQRLAAILMSAVLAVAVWAAPAPTPRHWIVGWDKPVDRLGKCHFARTYLISAPGAGWAG